MKRDISRLYSVLSGEERFKATLAALSRGDDEDAQRLIVTCPRKSYDCRDAAFSDRMSTSRLLTLAFALDWLTSERALNIIENEAVNYASANNEISERLNMVLEIKRKKLKTELEAFETFCDEINVPVKHLLSWFPFIMDWIEARREELAGIEPDEELLSRLLDAYREIWKQEGTKFN